MRAIQSGRNGGFAFGCNIGMAAGEAPYVLFLNPDARISPEGIAALQAGLESEPDVAIAGPRILEEDGSLVHSMRRFQRVGSTWATALFLHRVIRAPWANEIIRDPAAYERVAHPEWLSGACMFTRRSALEPLGGFDEGYFLYGEDMDLCARVRGAGHQVRFEPGAVARHEGGQSAPRTSLYAVLAASRTRFARRHYGRVSAAAQRVGLAVGALTHIAAAVRRPAHREGHAKALRTLDRSLLAAGRTRRR